MKIIFEGTPNQIHELKNFISLYAKRKGLKFHVEDDYDKELKQTLQTKVEKVFKKRKK